MTKFTKYINIKEKLPADHQLVDSRYVPLVTDTTKFNRHSAAELDKVLDTIQLSPREMAKLKQIIEAASK